MDGKLEIQSTECCSKLYLHTWMNEINLFYSTFDFSGSNEGEFKPFIKHIQGKETKIEKDWLI